jgi:hypothetical protein
MSLDSGAIATAIAGMTITGVTIKDITGIPQQVQPRDCPILFPHPDEWKQGGNGEPSDGSTTFGTPTGRTWIFNRTYKYVYLHASVGAGRGIYEQYTDMSDKEDAISTALTQLDITSVDVKSVSISSFGTLKDPAGNGFYGFLVSITFREWING